MIKKGMSLITLVVTLIIMIIITGVIVIGVNNTGIIQKAENIVVDMDIKNIQQLANIAYANIYFDNLTQGIRRELTAEEIRSRLIKEGTEEDILDKYSIVIKNSDVIVTLKEK